MEYWYALYTRSRNEKKVYDLLLEKNQEVFLPLVTKVRLWKDRKKKVEMALFSSYLFARFDYKNRFDILQTKGVIKIVNFKGIPAIVPDWQINSLKKMLEIPEKIRLENYIKVGAEVEVIEGVFKGMRGSIQTIKGDMRLTVSIAGIMQTISVEIDSAFIKKLEVAQSE